MISQMTQTSMAAGPPTRVNGPLAPVYRSDRCVVPPNPFVATAAAQRHSIRTISPNRTPAVLHKLKAVDLRGAAERCRRADSGGSGSACTDRNAPARSTAALNVGTWIAARQCQVPGLGPRFQDGCAIVSGLPSFRPDRPPRTVRSGCVGRHLLARRCAHWIDGPGGRVGR
jgi:hypothetical protein